MKTYRLFKRQGKFNPATKMYEDVDAFIEADGMHTILTGTKQGAVLEFYRYETKANGYETRVVVAIFSALAWDSAQEVQTKVTDSQYIPEGVLGRMIV